MLKDLLKKSGSSLSQLQLDELIFEVNSREEQGDKGSAMARFLGRGLRNKIPNSVDRTVNFKELIRRRREEREKRVKKEGRTEEKKLVFSINENVRLQCPKSKLWNIRGKIHGLRYSETGQIVSYDVLLENGKLTSRHRRFMTRDIPENVGSQPGQDEDIHGAPSPGVSGAASGHSREGSNITNEGVTGVITRSKKRFLANTAHGKVPGGTGLVTKSKCGSQVTPHSQRKVTGEMGSSSCVSVPLLCLGVWAILSSLVIAVLSFFLNQCSGRSLRSMTSVQPVDCVEMGPQYSETNLDFLNVDISEKKILDSAEGIKCDCNWETILEWGIFEISVVVLLVCIFCYLCLGDGMSHFSNFLKKRNSDENRLQKELEMAVRKQEKLMQKMGKAGAAGPAPTAHASTVEEKPQFSAL